MNLTNYESEIEEATRNIPFEVQTLYEKSEEILTHLMDLKKVTDSECLAMNTLALTKECVPILNQIKDKVGATHALYKLQTAKLFNIVINSSAHWSKLWMNGVRQKTGKTTDVDTQKQLSAYRLCMDELSRLTFLGDNKNEFDRKYKEMFGSEVKPHGTNTGCMVVIAFLIVSAVCLSLI